MSFYLPLLLEHVLPVTEMQSFALKREVRVIGICSADLETFRLPAASSIVITPGSARIRAKPYRMDPRLHLYPVWLPHSCQDVNPDVSP